ncbi:MAG: CAP domain-containing protein [Eubacterium sp.]|nr:CAP domain-containing protein [Eubacterium sp.]
MKKAIRNLFFLLVAGILLSFTRMVGSDAKDKKIPTVLDKGYSTVVYRINQKEKIQKGIVTLKTIKVQRSNKSVASVKVRKDKDVKGRYYYVEVTGKKCGNVKITVKVKKKMPSGKNKTVVTKIKIKIPSNKQRAKEAFELQNTIRKKAGKKELEWSEELYQIAVIRVEKDGFDRHKNFRKRWHEHFSVDGLDLDETFFDGGENLYIGSSNPTHAIKSWKNSPGHYANMIDNSYQCGAMAYDDKTDTWVAVFSKNPLSVIENWRTDIPLLRLSRIDNKTGERIRGSQISIIDDVGNEVYRGWSVYIFNSEIFTVGKAYTVIEISTPVGYQKADSVTFVAKSASEGVIEIVLSSDKK